MATIAHRGGRVIHTPQALDRMRRGFDALGALIVQGLGPAPGTVLNARDRRSVEVLTESGTIARRIVELPDRVENTGAMALRHLVWRMHERYGDGGATAATLALAMVRDAAARIAAGANPMRLHDGMRAATAAARIALAAQAQPCAGPDALAGVATGVTGDSELGAILGELFDLLGPHAAITIEEFTSPHLDREYLAGGRWPARPASRDLLPATAPELALEHPLVVVVDGDVSRAEDVQPALELAARSPGRPPLLLVARSITGAALATIALNHTRATVTIGAASLTSATSAQADDLADIALMTGATLLGDAAGRPPSRLQPDQAGRCRRAVIGARRLTITDGAGDRRDIQVRIDELRHRADAPGTDQAARDRLRTRAASLAGGIGILKLGARSERDRAERRALAERAIRVLCPAMTAGVVPGGGVALLGCRQAVRSAAARTDGDEAEGMAIVGAALAAPFRQIVRNHGRVSPGLALDRAERSGQGFGYDARSGQIVEMSGAGIVDSAAVTEGALLLATSAAGMAITTGAIYLPAERRRERMVRP